MFDILDFDANFKAYCEKWIDLNKGKFRTYEQMEDAIPEVYLRWLNSPAAFLDGETPGAYFQKYNSAPELVKWLRMYDAAGVSVPDQLLDRISDLGQAAVKPLLYTAKEEKYTDSLRSLALNLLKEVDAGDAPLEVCLNLIDGRKEDDDLADVAAELLGTMASRHVDEIAARLEDVNEFARETYLDVLTNYPGDERVFQALIKDLDARRDRVALFAALLGKYGDERALDALNAALEWEEINYLDFLEIKDAIENLGGECLSERDFTGDAYYEAFKQQNQDS